MRNIFILNPVSGAGKAINFEPVIKEYFEKNGGEYEIVTTQYPKHATEIARSYTEDDNVVLYAVGGDGTMKEIIDGINEGVRACVIPAGTGNDFYKTITLDKYSEQEIIEASIKGRDVNIDYGLFNGTSKFMNVISFGLDAAINYYANNVLKKKGNKSGSLVYAKAAFTVGLHPETYHMELEVDGVKSESDTILMAIANGTYYGGVFNAFPLANISDGIFNSTYFKPVKFFRLIYLIILYLKGKHLNEKECIMANGKNYHLKFDREIDCQIDGENVRVTEATIEMQAGKMKFRIPVFNK